MQSFKGSGQGPAIPRFPESGCCQIARAHEVPQGVTQEPLAETQQRADKGLFRPAVGMPRQEGWLGAPGWWAQEDSREAWIHCSLGRPCLCGPWRFSSWVLLPLWAVETQQQGSPAPVGCGDPAAGRPCPCGPWRPCSGAALPLLDASG